MVVKHPLSTAVGGTSPSYTTIARARNPSIECTTSSTWEGDDAVVLNSEVGGVGNEISIIECDVKVGCWFLENYFSGTF